MFFILLGFFGGVFGFLFFNKTKEPATCQQLYWIISPGPHWPLNNRVSIFSYVKILNSFIKWSRIFGINLLSDNTLIVTTILIIKNLTPAKDWNEQKQLKKL